VVHHQDGGRTSLANLKDFLLLAPSRGAAPDGLAAGWQLTVYPDGTSQITSPGGKIIRSHSPPAKPG
jgi:hypothetical protein